MPYFLQKCGTKGTQEGHNSGERHGGGYVGFSTMVEIKTGALDVGLKLSE
jgi:hypothetical protein